MYTPRLHALHVGRPATHGTEGADAPMDRPWRSAIFKARAEGPVFLGKTNLEGDEQADQKNHGGPDKAVCAYPLAHLPYWAERLGRDEIGSGAFGENFTLAGVDEKTACIGDVYAVGAARVQVSQPRSPCWKLARRWQEKKLALWVQEMGYTGWYLRVLETGAVEAGQPLVLKERPHPEWPVARVNDVRYGREEDPALRTLRHSPLAPKRMNTLTALTIAGSDPSGGAGMQADLKTFAACGVYGMAALTVATDCNTADGVTQVEALPPAFVRRQIDRVCADIPPDTVKTGMLFSEALLRVVAKEAERHGFPYFVVDPVMTTRRGERLLSDGAEAALIEVLLPRAACTTPSLPEAARLAGFPVETRGDMERAAEAVHALGPGAVIVTGGHLEGDRAADCFFDGGEMVWLEAERVPRQMHGAGDSFSAALAAGLAQGLEMLPAARQAKAFVTGAVRHAPRLGRGNGPLGHAWSGRPFSDVSAPAASTDDGC